MKEQRQFNPESWYQNLVRMAALPLRPRYDSLVALHAVTLQDYVAHLTSMTEETAYQLSSDGRTRALVVAHIMAWEQWQTQIFADPDKEERVKKQMRLEGYYDDEKDEYVDFNNVDDFNSYQAQKYANWRWEDIRKKAIKVAKKLQSFFPENPSEEWLNFLEETQPYSWKLTEEHTLTVPATWYLWMVSLEHEAVEHRKDLEVD
ncbi:hypothetical protein HY612_05135 [Candidatus Roizmanbacteria bacterium]|nr:hypothetical protein [Candidatus Roizmanbacteria bacterium]